MVAKSGNGMGHRQGHCCSRGYRHGHLRSNRTARVSAMRKDTGTRHRVRQATPAGL